MKYIELVKGLFTAEHETRAYQADPYVAYSIEDDRLKLNLIPEHVVYVPYVTFTAEEDNSTIGLTKLSTNQTLEYSTDTSNWNTFNTTTNITLTNVGDKVYVRGILSNDNTNSYTKFKMTGKIAASGNCNALWDYNDLNAPLKAYCGNYMFQGCTSLTTAPELPSTLLADYCYQYMFDGCKNLIQAPSILPATTLASRCYYSMFDNCTSLIQAPELPATTLTKSCYEGMFDNCTSLIQAPSILPAATLKSRCYAYMFSGCTSLTTAPELPATTLAEECYNYMFQGCSNLNYIKCLATDISASLCTYNWAINVSPTGTFSKHPNMSNWYTGNSGIPSGWTVEDAEL